MVSFWKLACTAFSAFFFCSSFTACSAPPSLYRWGGYEESIYQHYDAAAANPQELSALLSEDIERTQAEGLRVPPGAHAFLGYLFASQGDFAAARSEFLNEKLLFPESAVFMDRLIKGMDGAVQ